MRAQLRECAVELTFELTRACEQPLALDDRDVCESGCAHRRVARVRLPVQDDVARLLPERLGHSAGDEHAAEREIAAGHALRERDEVGRYAVALAADPVADA